MQNVTVKYSDSVRGRMSLIRVWEDMDTQSRATRRNQVWSRDAQAEYMMTLPWASVGCTTTDT